MRRCSLLTHSSGVSRRRTADVARAGAAVAGERSRSETSTRRQRAPRRQSLFRNSRQSRNAAPGPSLDDSVTSYIKGRRSLDVITPPTSRGHTPDGCDGCDTPYCPTLAGLLWPCEKCTENQASGIERGSGAVWQVVGQEFPRPLRRIRGTAAVAHLTTKHNVGRITRQDTHLDGGFVPVASQRDQCGATKSCKRRHAA